MFIPHPLFEPAPIPYRAGSMDRLSPLNEEGNSVVWITTSEASHTSDDRWEWLCRIVPLSG